MHHCIADCFRNITLDSTTKQAYDSTHCECIVLRYGWLFLCNCTAVKNIQFPALCYCTKEHFTQQWTAVQAASCFNPAFGLISAPHCNALGKHLFHFLPFNGIKSNLSRIKLIQTSFIACIRRGQKSWETNQRNQFKSQAKLIDITIFWQAWSVTQTLPQFIYLFGLDNFKF